jgi:phosphinothricin acetyltransferase
MHRSMGYELIGTFPKAGFKLDRWLDVVWMAKTIGEKESAPQAFVKFQDVETSDVEKVLEDVNLYIENKK